MIANNRYELEKLIDNNPNLAAQALDECANSIYELARSNAADLGSHEHREALINDYSEMVRAGIAIHGTDEQRDRLLNDDHPMVQRMIEIHSQRKVKT